MTIYNLPIENTFFDRSGGKGDLRNECERTIRPDQNSIGTENLTREEGEKIQKLIQEMIQEAKKRSLS